MTNKLFAIITAFGLLMLLAGFVTDTNGKNDFDAAKEVIAMRNIAHQVLQSVGDSTSRVLPVNRLSPTEFQIPFESSFSFKTDSLVHIIDKVVAANKLPSTYIVNVLKYNTDTVIYGYAKSGLDRDSIMPCGGRQQPTLPYSIDIKFRESKFCTAKNFYAGGIGLCGLGLFMLGASQIRRRGNISKPPDKNLSVAASRDIPIGKYIFYPEEQMLKFNGQESILTVKEAKILSIFARAQNQIIDRKRLQKEIWEDEGVIVGRSLDMFISRLRKKLEGDPDIKLVNIHSKGYKLEINGAG